MAQFSMEIMRLTGSVLRGNQHLRHKRYEKAQRMDNEDNSQEQQLAKSARLKKAAADAGEFSELDEVVFELCSTFESYMKACDVSWQKDQ